MTVNTTPVEINYTGNASTTVFALPFAFAANAHVKVYLGGVLQGSGYSITGAGNPSGGTLTMTTAPGAGVALKARRVTPLTQDIDVVNNATVFASSLETGLDYALMRQQEEAFDRATLDTATAAALALKVSKPTGSGFITQNPDGSSGISSGTGADAGLRTDLAASGGSALVGFLQAGSGAVARTVQTKMRDAINAADFGVVADGTTDDGPALRLALAAGVSLGRPVALPKTNASILVSYDPASSLGGGLYGYSILIPTGTRLITNGATIKAANGITSWNRVVSFANQANIVIEGVLRVDANAANRGTPVNEHMHGVFFFNSTDIRIPDGIDSQNAVGDNMYVGGTDNTVGTTRVWIGDVYCKTAGRKNFVAQSCLNVFVGDCLLDNISGGSAVGGAADSTECHSLDIEPDAFTGATPNDITFGNIVTYGSGNDFTAGTTAIQGDAWVVRFKSLISYITPKAGVKPWEQNAITIIGEELKITGITATASQSLLAYAARLFVRDIEISGGNTDFLIKSANTANNIPVVRAEKLRLTNTTAASTSTAGSGWANDGGTIDIGDFYPVTTNTAFWNRGTTAVAADAGALRIGRLFAKNIGEPGWGNYGILQSFIAGVENYLEIGLVDYEDTRGTKLDRVIYMGAGAGISGQVHVGGYINRSGVELLKWTDATGFYRTGPRETVSKGTPEAVITAGIGSLNLRVDGGAATSFYIKESGTGNTGWVAK